MDDGAKTMTDRLRGIAIKAAEQAEAAFNAGRWQEAAILLAVASNALEATAKAAQYALILHIGQTQGGK